jgi:uncharacterized protein YbaR (Trm112 family)
MFIELSEYLACPGEHEPTYLVVATGIMSGRDILHGTIGCPACGREFLIDRAVAGFGSPPERAAPDLALPAADDVQAVLGLGSPGGYVVLVGSAARLAAGLALQVPGVHFATVNAPDDVEPATYLSLLEDRATVPLKTAVTRGAVVGSEYADAAWLAEGARVVLRGQQLVVLRERLDAEPAGIDLLAVGRGMWVGKKR